MVMGDPEILCQVRMAIIAASKIDSNPARVPLSRLFHSALRAGRRVREETSIGLYVPSLSQAAVELARRLLGDRGALRVLLVGEGEGGKAVAGELTAAGGGDLTVVNRTDARGEELARQLGAKAAPFSEIGRVLHNMDVVICAATAPEFVVTCDLVAKAVADRGRQPIYLFDMTVPRNIDPTAGALKGVYLFNIDDIGLIAWHESQTSRTGAIQAGEIVEEELGEFLEEWITSMGAAPLNKFDYAFCNMRGLASGRREQPYARARPIVKNQLHGLIDSLTNEAGNPDWLDGEEIGKPPVVDGFRLRRLVDYMELREAA